MEEYHIGKEIEKEERINLLMPEDELHVLETSQVAEFADDYFTSSRQKPLLMFFDNGEIVGYERK